MRLVLRRGGGGRSRGGGSGAGGDGGGGGSRARARSGTCILSMPSMSLHLFSLSAFFRTRYEKRRKKQEEEEKDDETGVSTTAVLSAVNCTRSGLGSFQNNRVRLLHLLLLFLVFLLLLLLTRAMSGRGTLLNSSRRRFLVIGIGLGIWLQ